MHYPFDHNSHHVAISSFPCRESDYLEARNLSIHLGSAIASKVHGCLVIQVSAPTGKLGYALTENLDQDPADNHAFIDYLYTMLSTAVFE